MELEARTKLHDMDNFSDWRDWDGNEDWKLTLHSIFTGSSRGMIVSVRHLSGNIIEFRVKE